LEGRIYIVHITRISNWVALSSHLWSPEALELRVRETRGEMGGWNLEVEDEKTRGSQGSIHISLGCAIEQHTIPFNYLHHEKKVVSICLLEHEILDAI
jgi:hypothetical protein